MTGSNLHHSDDAAAVPLKANVDRRELDAAMEAARQLDELLKQANSLAGELACKVKTISATITFD